MSRVMTHARTATGRQKLTFALNTRPAAVLLRMRQVKGVGRYTHVHYCRVCGCKHRDCRCGERAS